MAESRLCKNRLIRAEREARAVELRKQGFTFEEISQDLGCSRTAAYKAVERAMNRTVADVKDRADTLRALELARLDEMVYALWAKAMKGDPECARVLLKVSERRARLLGLDAPTKIEDVTPPTEREPMTPEEAVAVQVAALRATGLAVLDYGARREPAGKNGRNGKAKRDGNGDGNGSHPSEGEDA